MKETHSRWVILSACFIVSGFIQGCGTFHNLTSGPVPYIRDTEFADQETKKYQPFSNANVVAFRENQRLQDRSQDIQMGDVLPYEEPPMIYGGLSYNLYWIFVWDADPYLNLMYISDEIPRNIAITVFGIIDFPCTLVMDTITGPFILVFGERYIGL